MGITSEPSYFDETTSLVRASSRSNQRSPSETVTARPGRGKRSFVPQPSRDCRDLVSRAYDVTFTQRWVSRYAFSVVGFAGADPR